MRELRFDPRSPFPVINADTLDLESLKAHSSQVDAWLGFDTLKTEEAIRAQGSKTGLRPHLETWDRVGPDVFQTPYVELAQLVANVSAKPEAIWADVGAGYGRLAHVLKALRPDCSYMGVEIVHERVQEATRLFGLHQCSNAKIMEGDVLNSQEWQKADVFFVYEFGSTPHIRRFLDILKERAQQKAVEVVARGHRLRQLIETGHPWLSQVVQPKHFRRASIYRSWEEFPL